MSATLQLPPVFLDDFLTKAATAKERVWLQSMNYEVGKMAERLEPVLMDCAQQNIDVRLEIDWVAQRFVHGHLPLIPVLNPTKRQYGQDLHQRNLESRARLSAAGVKVIEVNHASIFSQVFPTLRRNHIKLFVIDHDYAWLGGVNLLDRAFECQDFMVRYDQPQAIKILTEQFTKVNQHRPANNHTVALNQTDTLLVDAGKIADSIIYNHAIAASQSAEHKIRFVSQIVPEGKLLQSFISAAEKGIKVEVITNYEKAKKRWSPAHMVTYQIFRQRIDHQPNIKFRHSEDRVHAKLLLIDDHLAIFGSHNMVDTGVLMGTEEIAVQTIDPQLLSQLHHFYRHMA